MLQHIHLHIAEFHLIESLHDGQLYLCHIEIAFGILVLIVAQTFQVCLDLLLELEVSDLCVTVLHLTS